MAIDLEVVTPDIDLGIFKKLLGEKTHFIYELVQNADDSESTLLGLRLYENELFVWNDGCPFSQEDVQSICSTGSSDKDLTQIGNFGIGFKSVYNYTDLPEIHSNDVCFRIPYLQKPEAIDMDPRIAELLDKNVTVVFRLPFKDSLLPEDITNLENHLYNLEKKRSLLFLRHLKTIQWHDEKNGQTGSYFCLRPDKPRNPSQVELKASINGENQLSETFLVFRKEVQPQEDVIDRLQDQAENCKEEDRIQRSREELQFIEVAFKLQDGKITTLDGCMLFAYLPTEIKTNLRFLIQARYQTTPSRENIVKPSESLWNNWLLQETATFLPEVLKQLKDCGLLEPIFFNVLPLKEDSVPEDFKFVVEVLQKAMREKAFVPTEKEGHYAKAKNVFYPHRESLRELVKSDWLYPNSSWLHPEIRDMEEFRRSFKVMREARVKEIEVSQVLDWLEKQEVNWFENRCEEWTRSLYIYLNSQKSELERIKKLPLVRLENGQHVCSNEQLVFFPPDADEEREEIKPFLSDLPILRPVLLEGEERNEIEVFLKSVGVKVMRRVDMILEGICPQYLKSSKPSMAENCLHVRYLFRVWNDVSESERSRLEKSISEVPILRAYKGRQREASDFVVPCNVYLPQAYTGNNDLETYFSISDGDIWFVNDMYLKGNPDTKTWLRFLKAIGGEDAPRVIKKNVPINDEECIIRDIWRRTITSTGEETIEDSYLHCLSDVLDEIQKHNKLTFSQAIWYLLVKTVPLGEQERNTFFQGTYCSRYRSNTDVFPRHFEATFYRQLKETAWLPDEHGNLHSPSECFVPTGGNRRVLGDSVAYLHPDFDVSQDNETSRWLAEKLGIHLNANTDSVLNYLQTLSGTKTNVEKVEPLYRFLARQDARRSEEFKQKPLIFTSNPEPNWWQADEVFWVNESPVFGNRRGSLKDNYGETLKGFFIGLGVRESAVPLDYVHAIQEVTSEEQANNVQVQKRVENLYRRLWLSLQEKEDLLEDEEWQEKWGQVREDTCWLGRKGDEWGFFSPHELVWNNHPYITEIFQGKVPFWAFDDDLVEFVKDQGVEGCSEANVTFHPSGDREEDTDWSEKVRQLRPYIDAFLKSPPLCEEHKEDKSTRILDCLSVCLVEELKMTYTLKEIPVTCPNPHPSALDATKVILWLALAAEKNEYAEMIGDALQDYFRVKELGRFIEDLLTKNRNRVLSRWNQKGLRTDLYELAPEVDSKESEEKPLDPVDAKLPGETDSGDDVPEGNESDTGTPSVHEVPETGSGKDDSAGNTSKTHSSGGHWGGASTTRTGTGGHSERGGGGEGDAHRNLKDYLAANPSELDEGFKLIKTEYRFTSGDEADILFEDSSKNPITVEVETYIPSKNYVGIWQAVKYQHLAAMEYNLPCEEVRSILAAPEIPDDVKTKCEKLNIEPIEVPHLRKN